MILDHSASSPPDNGPPQRHLALPLPFMHLFQLVHFNLVPECPATRSQSKLTLSQPGVINDGRNRSSAQAARGYC